MHPKISSDNLSLMPIDLDKQVKLFMLPFLYFYFLSFGLLTVISYMLLRNPLGITQSLAQTSNSPINSEFNINLSVDSNDIKIQTLSNEPEEPVVPECDKDSAGKIDTYFGKLKLPLAGHGCDFDIHGQLNKVKPEVVAAIAMCESTGGKVTPQFKGEESYNAFGWAVFDSNETTKDVDGYKCDSWEHCIGRVTRGIARNSAKRNLSTEPADIVKWYNPGSIQRAGGVIENSSWYQCVNKTVSKIQNTVPLHRMSKIMLEEEGLTSLTEKL